MPHRYKEETHPFLNLKEYKPPRLFQALSEKMREGYHIHDFKSDVMSGLVVAMVAIPLSMALAIASGVAPQHGLYTVIFAGTLVALMGGSRFQVTGPTAAFVVVLSPIATKYGVGGLLTAGLMAGAMLLAMGIARMGRLIQFIPYPVTTGFTSGIAVVIATLQIKDFFGLQIASMPEGYLQKLRVILGSLSSFSISEFCIAASTLLLLVVWPKMNKRIPSPLIVLGFVSVVTAMIKSHYPEWNVATIGSRFNGIPKSLPTFMFPWSYGANPFVISFSTIKALLPSAFAIAMLGAIESLLSAVVADGMAHTKHEPDSELMALGIGNLLCPFFGGIAATGAIARTATNIRFGAKSPISSVLHGIATLIVILVFASYVSYLPMAALSALLLLVAYNMSEVKHFRHILNQAPRSDVAVLLICFFLTVVFDMVIGVTTGVMLAALLFMKRMAAVTSSEVLNSQSHASVHQVPSDVLLYDVNGPLFFGAAEKAMSAMKTVSSQTKAVFLLMEDVPMMDMTGLVALESMVEHLIREKKKVYMIGVKSQPMRLILKSDTVSKNNSLFFCKTVDYAVQHHQEKGKV